LNTSFSEGGWVRALLISVDNSKVPKTI